jgi:hypothetical protein
VNAPPHDPLLHEIDLPLKQVLYPLGFPLEIATNSPDVLRAATRAWSAFPNLFTEPPIHLRVIVTGSGDETAPAEPPVYRGQAHLLTIAAGVRDFAVADLQQGFSFACITPRVAADAEYLRHFFLEALVYSTLTNLHLTSVHAACVSLAGRAILLCGASGAGKSTLAYECARRGFAYLADDGSSFLRRGGGRTVIGKPMRMRLRPDAGEIFPELRPLLPSLAVNGKPAVEVDMPRLPGIETAITARVEAVVFLNRAPEFDAQLLAIPKSEARARLASEIPVLERRSWQEQIASLDRLLEARTFELRYAEAAHAATALEQFLTKEHRDETAVLAVGGDESDSGAGGIERAAR